MARVTSLPDGLDFEVPEGETLLEAALRAQVPLAHACGGRAKCSTCRVWVLDGMESCPERTERERLMADRLGLPDEVRLACQLRASGPVRIRRLVLDETDLIMSSQLDRGVPTRSGEAKDVTIFFSDVADFTALSERLTAYDVMYLLNRYFVQAGEIIERNGGYIDKFVGDGIMAIFGVDGQSGAPLAAVNAALQTLAAADRLKPFFAALFDAEFDIRIGLHHGEAVLGSVGSAGHERLTAIGDVVNVTSRIEAANKEAGTRLLISEALVEKVRDQVEIGDFVRVRLRGTSERMTLYEIARLTPEADQALNRTGPGESFRSGGRTWRRVFAEDALAAGEHRIVGFGDRDVVIWRDCDGLIAFDNACPHMNLPLFDRRDLPEGALGNYPHTDRPRPINSVLTGDRGVVCRWHESCFDLQTGEIRDWVPRLEEDGTSLGWEFLGDISKNRCRLAVYPCRVIEGELWVSLE